MRGHGCGGGISLVNASKIRGNMKWGLLKRCPSSKSQYKIRMDAIYFLMHILGLIVHDSLVHITLVHFVNFYQNVITCPSASESEMTFFFR